jgi:hypothetical protein
MHISRPRPGTGPTAARAGALLALACVLAGCGAQGNGAAGRPAHHSKATPSRSARPSPSPSRTASPSPTPLRTTGVHGCYDGTCTVVVAAHTRITFDGRLGVSGITVDSVGPDGVDMSADTSGGMAGHLLSQRPDQGGASTVNNMDIAVRDLAGPTARITFSRHGH